MRYRQCYRGSQSPNTVVTIEGYKKQNIKRWT